MGPNAVRAPIDMQRTNPECLYICAMLILSQILSHIKCLHVAHDSYAGVHIHLSLDTKCPLQRKPSERRQNVKRLFKSDKLSMKAPGMANLVSLCLSQGEGTAVGFSLVDESSNHIDVIIRNLGK